MRRGRLTDFLPGRWRGDKLFFIGFLSFHPNRRGVIDHPTFKLRPARPP